MKKETVIRFRVTKDEKEKLEKWCRVRDTDPSKELRKFIKNITSKE